MKSRRIVVIGASAGGVEALTRVVSGLRPGFAAPVLIVLHIPSGSAGLLPHILQRVTSARVNHAIDGEALVPGHVYVAPPDLHLLVDGDNIALTRGPRENRHRPAIDPMFRSAAAAYGSGAIGVILSGTLDDGTAGLLEIKQRGGLAVVQEPTDALYSGMPLNAIEHVDVDHVAASDDIAALLATLVDAPPPAAVAGADDAGRDLAVEGSGLSPFSCPECGGVLWEVNDASLRFRCQIGHAYSPETMLSAQGDAAEASLWSALNTLEESARLAERLADRETKNRHDALAERFRARARDAQRNAVAIREVLARQRSETTAAETDEAAK